MWTRKELKERAKLVMNRSYWKAVLVALIVGICAGGSPFFSSSWTGNSASFKDGSDAQNSIHYFFDSMSPSESAFVSVVVIGILIAFLVASLVWFAICLFVLLPAEVGCRRFFIVNRVESAQLSELGYGFKNSYWNVVKTQFLRCLFTFLWSLLFLIPGIIKSYEYRMIPYILAENPEMDYKEAFRLSKEMMMGEKWRAFVLDLSFILWYLLSACTCGILSLFYVGPYVQLTNAELYAVLKEQLFSGTTPTEEASIQ